MWDLIVSVPDHCLSFYFENIVILRKHELEPPFLRIFAAFLSKYVW